MLHIRVGDRLSVIVPNQIVETVEELEALGSDRIQDLIKTGFATHELEIMISGMRARRMIDPALQAEGEQARVVAQDVLTKTNAALLAVNAAADRERQRQRDALQVGIAVPAEPGLVR
jgi:hypothetical protein